MIYLTSSPTGPLDSSWTVDGIDVSNGFREDLKKYWKQPSRVLMACASPESFDANDEMTDFFANAFITSGLDVKECVCMDYRWDEFDSDYIRSFDVIVLCGGHVPTQNHYFTEIGFRDIIKDYSGIIIGISAGSMNAASIVYCQPEEYGEATDPYFSRYIPGLGLTDTNILPHHNMACTALKENGLRLFEDITLPDSYNRSFYSLKDGSYLKINDSEETVFGECYLIRDGKIEVICSDNESFRIK